MAVPFFLKNVPAAFPGVRLGTILNPMNHPAFRRAGLHTAEQHRMMAQPGVPGGRGNQAKRLAPIQQRWWLVKVAACAKLPFPLHLISGCPVIFLGSSGRIRLDTSINLLCKAFRQAIASYSALISWFEDDPPWRYLVSMAGSNKQGGSWIVWVGVTDLAGFALLVLYLPRHA